LRTVLSLLLLAALAGPVHAQSQVPAPPRVERIDVYELGLYRADVAGRERALGTATGARSVLSNIEHVKTTTEIEAKPGTHFGFRYRVDGRPNGREVPLTAVLLYPQPGVKNPTTGNTIVRAEHTLRLKIGNTSYRGYVFEHEWELVPGTWTFELWDGERKLSSQSFEIVRAKD